MRNERKPILHTNIVTVTILCIVLAAIMSGATENLQIFIATMLTIPIVLLILLILWLKYGFSGIHMNSICLFVMLTMMSVYSSIPLYSVIWGHWLAWLPIFIHIVTFVFGYINREKLILRLNGIEDEESKKPSRFILYYSIGILLLGIFGFTIVVTNANNVSIFAFLYLIGYFLFAIGPAFLVPPERALELGVITKRHYEKYN